MSDTLAVFISYAHADQRLRDRLERHLSQLKADGMVQVWHDRHITAGQEFDREIDENLRSADVILLLISEDFMASGYCTGIELKRAMERHAAGEARVIPVILRPVDWHSAPFGKLVALPKDGKAVTDWANRDRAFLDVASGLRAAVRSILDRRRGEGGNSTRAVPPSDGRAFDFARPLPPLPRRPGTEPPPLTVGWMRQTGRLQALAEAFDTERAAYGLLKRARIDHTRIPGWTGPLEFWEAACHKLELGLVKDGLRVLLRTAAQEYPDSPVPFAPPGE